MIITCENCHTRYLVASSSIGEEGRTVRCTNCGHEWFQEYERIDAGFLMDEEDGEEGIFAEESTVTELEEEPIPQSVRPGPLDSSLPAPKDAIEGNSDVVSSLAGYAFALFVFLALIAALVVFRGPVSNAWPVAKNLYGIFGLLDQVPGEGLIFDQIVATSSVDDKYVNTLEITGNIINLTNQVVEVPSMLSELRTAEGGVYDVWAVTPPVQNLPPLQEVGFKTSYPAVPSDVTTVTIRFVTPE